MWGASWSGLVGDSPADWPRPPGARKHPGEGVERSVSGQATARPTDSHHHGSCSPSQQPSASPAAAAANAEAKSPPGSHPGGIPTGAPPRVILPLLAPSRCARLTWASSSRRRTRLALASSAWRPTRPGHGSSRSPICGRGHLRNGRNDCGFVSHLRGCTGSGWRSPPQEWTAAAGSPLPLQPNIAPPSSPASSMLHPSSHRNAPPSGLRRYRDPFLTRHYFCSCAMTSAPFGNCGGFHTICSNPVGDPLAAVNRDQFQSPISRDHISHESRPSLKRKWCSCELGSRLIIERGSSKIMYQHSPAIIVT